MSNEERYAALDGFIDEAIRAMAEDCEKWEFQSMREKLEFLHECVSCRNWFSGFPKAEEITETPVETEEPAEGITETPVETKAMEILPLDSLRSQVAAIAAEHAELRVPEYLNLMGVSKLSAVPEERRLEFLEMIQKAVE